MKDCATDTVSMVENGDLDIFGARLSRRGLLKAGGMLVAAASVAPGFAIHSTRAAENSLDATRPESWIEIHADDSIVIRTGKCDFGQSSIYTAYRQIVAEELGVPVEAITTVVTGDTDRTPDGGGTFGLLRTNVLNLRKAAAYTREAVLKLAAIEFGEPVDNLTITDGIIRGTRRQARHAEIIAGQDLALAIPVSGELTSFRGLVVTGEPPLKDPKHYTVVGKPVKNPIVRKKVSGEAVWVGDVKLPNMLHARVIHPATLGSRLLEAGKVDKDRFPDVQTVVVGNLLAVVSKDEWTAVQAAQVVGSSTRWSQWQGLPGSENLEAHLRDSVDWSEVAPTEGRANVGDTATESPSSHQASYFVPYHKHAPIGPTVSLADVRADGAITVHTHSQNPQYLRHLIARMVEQDEDSVVIRTYPGPGHFGRSNGGNAGSEDEAVLLSRALGVPVRVQWMRADDMQWSTQSSTMLSDISIGLDRQGRIETYRATHSGPPMQDDRPIGAVLAGLPTISAPVPNNPSGLHATEMRVADSWVYEAIENVSETGRGTYQVGERESPIHVGLRDHSMRTPIQYQQNFPREAAISEAAALAGKDALQFRLDHVTDPRFRAILVRLREESGWETRPSPAPGGSRADADSLAGRGVSIMFRDNGYWACAAQISVAPKSGKVSIQRMTLVCDTGIVVNPLQLRRQAEAGCLMGVSQALHEEVTFDEGAITSTHWALYPILTIAEAPRVDVIQAPFEGATVYGQGSESANALAAGAIAGAFFDATGKAVRRLPLRPDYVKGLLSL